MRLDLLATAAAIAVLTSSPGYAQEFAEQDLSNLSIEQLAQIKVTSASKREQPLSRAPASLYVIDHDQIVRSGAVTIPEILRLAPNLQVYQSSPSHWVVTARGLNGDSATQSYSNKLLVLVDGRTVYTPLFSGVYWDLPDLIPDDIERIEVISGPGATLWGANAVNGVINIITRSATSTAGAYAEVEGGTNEQIAGLRVGGSAAPNLAYRVYGRALNEAAASIPGDGSARDGWHRLGGGFRVDWTPSPTDTVTASGDLFGGKENEAGAPYEVIGGRDLVLRWDRQDSPDRDFQVQAFYDYMMRATRPDQGSFHVNTWDVDLQHSLPIDSRNELVWGGGVRLAQYQINGTSSLFFVPDSRNLFLANGFVQDTFRLSPLFAVTAGLKAERDPYVGTSLLPDVRMMLSPSKTTMLWAAVSHAVRSPTPFDEDVQERAPGVTLSGNPDFRTEKLTAYEVGVRTQPSSALSLSATGFYDVYDDLRTIEFGPGPGLNLYWSNGLAGHSYGLEGWVNYQPLDWWTLSAGATLLKERFHFKPGASGIIGTDQDGLDPDHWLTFRSSMNLGSSVTFDLDARAVGPLQGGAVPAYAELGGRLAWNVSTHLALSVSGQNLLHARHVEYPGGDAISRTVLAGVEWRP